MFWWMVCFILIILTLGAKFYFTRASSKLRQDLVRQQREALEKKGELSDARELQLRSVRHSKEKGASIKRLTTQIQELEDRIKKAQAEKQSLERPPLRPRR
ncbi:MAG: hypothetical protein O2954_16485 [bacterium]|nr:hypothetical protein [bacterium]